MRCVARYSPQTMRGCNHVINVLCGSYRVAPLVSARSLARANGRVNSLAAFFRRIISNDKKEKRRIRERVNDSDPQGVAAIKILRSRVTLHAETKSCAAADSEHKNVIFIARGGRALYIYRAMADYGR